jgi:hypothetical protein
LQEKSMKASYTMCAAVGAALLTASVSLRTLADDATSTTRPADQAAAADPTTAPTTREVERKWADYPRLSPFQAIRWDGEKATVRVRGKWYELVAINDDSTEQIIQWCKLHDDSDWQKRFDEDLVEVLVRAGRAPGTSVNLTVREPGATTDTTLTDVSMTQENRMAIFKARNQKPADGAPR